MKQSLLIKVMLAIFLVLATSGCGQVTSGSNFLLDKEQTISGPLVVFSNNATFEQGSSVDGSIFMLCCNLIVDGEVTGNIFLLSGNVRIGGYADANGDVTVISGNIFR